MERRIVDGEITLVPYYPNYKASLPWYQDADVCKQVDNRNSVYDLKLLKAMYRYLNARGSLFYIKYRGRLCGDVCLHPDGEINIVVAKSFQNKHIGRRVIGEIQKLAREQHIPKLHAEISASSSAAHIFSSSSGVSTLSPKSKFEAIVPEKSTAFCGIYPTLLRRALSS